jgi:hypothetical protein
VPQILRNSLSEILSLIERFAVHDDGYVLRRMEHQGVSLTADIGDRYPDPVNTVIVIFYSLWSYSTSIM